MEHIVSFGVGIDDTAIQKYIMEHATEQIMESLRKDVVNKLFTNKYCANRVDPSRDPLSAFSKDIITSIVQDYKDDIIEKASKYLADSLSRTKKVKAVLDLNLNSVEENI